MPAINRKTDISVTVLGMAMAVMFPLVISMVIMAYLPGDVPKLILSRLMYWAELALIMLFSGKLERQPLLLYKQAEYPWYFYLFWIITLFVFSFGCAMLSNIPGILGYNEQSVLLSHWLAIVTNNWWLLLLCTLTPAIAEELLFRGYLLSRLQQLFGNSALAVFLSALLFCNLHFKYYGLRETIFAFLIGLMLGFYYQHFRNIYVVIMVRFLINATVFMLFKTGMLSI